MSRSVYVYDPQQDKVVLREDKLPAPGKGPNVISDYIPPLKHMATGIVSDSKSHHRRMTKDTGCVEVGTDPAASRPITRPEPSMAEYAHEVRRALQEVNSR